MKKVFFFATIVAIALGSAIMTSCKKENMTEKNIADNSIEKPSYDENDDNSNEAKLGDPSYLYNQIKNYYDGIFNFDSCVQRIVNQTYIYVVPSVIPPFYNDTFLAFFIAGSGSPLKGICRIYIPWDEDKACNAPKDIEYTFYQYELLPADDFGEIGRGRVCIRRDNDNTTPNQAPDLLTFNLATPIHTDMQNMFPTNCSSPYSLTSINPDVSSYQFELACKIALTIAENS